MAETVGDELVTRLQEWGITRLYAFPGDGINGILGALRKSGDKPQLVQTRHEEMASFMACPHAKFTGEVGVCMAKYVYRFRHDPRPLRDSGGRSSSAVS